MFMNEICPLVIVHVFVVNNFSISLQFPAQLWGLLCKMDAVPTVSDCRIINVSL